MTTPVLVGAGAEGGRMSFLLPGADGIPAPQPEGDVELKVFPAGRYAVLRFKNDRKSSGYNSDAVLALEDELLNRNLQPAGAPFLAYYDPPWTPNFLRRNEVLVLIGE